MFNPTPKKILSVQNALVKHLVKVRQSKQYREKCGTVVVSGYKLVREIAEKIIPNKLFVENLEDSLPAKELFQTSFEVLKKISGLPSPEPIAAEFDLPEQSSLADKAPLLVLDAIRDPGNMGTLFRTALGFNWEGVFLLPTCVDPFHDKVIRSSRGALFHLPWKWGSFEELCQLKQSRALTAFIADMEGKSLSTLSPQKNSMLLLSNEAKGVSERAESFGEKISIPLSREVESLNVAIAGAIFMYALRL